MDCHFCRIAGPDYDLYLIPVFVPVPVACVRMSVGLRCATGWCLSCSKVIMQDFPPYICPLLTQGSSVRSSRFVCLTLFAESLF